MYIIGAMHQVAEANRGNLQCRLLHAELKKEAAQLDPATIWTSAREDSYNGDPQNNGNIYGNVMYHNDWQFITILVDLFVSIFLEITIIILHRPLTGQLHERLHTMSRVWLVWHLNRIWTIWSRYLLVLYLWTCSLSPPLGIFTAATRGTQHVWSQFLIRPYIEAHHSDKTWAPQCQQLIMFAVY